MIILPIIYQIIEDFIKGLFGGIADVSLAEIARFSIYSVGLLFGALFAAVRLLF